MNGIWSLCNIKLNENNYLKDRTVSKSFTLKIKKNKKNNTPIQSQQPKTDKNNDNDYNHSISAYENHRNVIIRPSYTGKIYYMLKIIEKNGDKKPIHIITRSHVIIQIIKQILKLKQ